MARQLNAQQKSWLNKCSAYYCSDDLNPAMVQKIVSMNDYETVYHDMDRFLQSRYFDQQNKISRF